MLNKNPTIINFYCKRNKKSFFYQFPFMCCTTDRFSRKISSRCSYSTDTFATNFQIFQSRKVMGHIKSKFCVTHVIYSRIFSKGFQIFSRVTVQREKRKNAGELFSTGNLRVSRDTWGLSGEFTSRSKLYDENDDYRGITAEKPRF